MRVFGAECGAGVLYGKRRLRIDWSRSFADGRYGGFEFSYFKQER